MHSGENLCSDYVCQTSKAAPTYGILKNRYARGAHTVLDLQYHLVWKTKYGYPVLRGEVGLRLRNLLKTICAENDIEVERGNVRANHIQVLVRAPSHLSVAKIAQYLKGKSSYRLLREFGKRPLSASLRVRS